MQEAPYEDEPLALVERGRLDFMFALGPPEGPFEHIEPLRDPRPAHPGGQSARAARDRAHAVRDRRLPLVAYSRSTYGIEALLRSRGIAPHVVFRSDESGAVQRMVAAGIGSALIPRLAIDPGITGVVALDASRRVPARQIGLAWHRDATLPAGRDRLRRRGPRALRRARANRLRASRGNLPRCTPDSDDEGRARQWGC